MLMGGCSQHDADLNPGDSPAFFFYPGLPRCLGGGGTRRVRVTS